MTPKSQLQHIYSAEPRTGWLLALALVCVLGTATACLPLRSLGRTISSPGHAQLQSDLVYLPGSSNPRHQLDFIRPASGAARGLVVFVHGGYWTNQDRRYLKTLVGLYHNIGFGLARHGYATAVISYRIHPGGQIAEQVADVQSALAWARRLLRRQTESTPTARQSGGAIAPRLFLMGHSAGGHLAMLAALADRQSKARTGDALAGVVAMSPILDVADMRASQSAEFNAGITTPVFGAGATADDLAAWSPGLRWTAAAPPLLLITGADDYPFIRRQARDFAAGRDAFAKRSGSIQAHELAGLEHADLVMEFEDAPELLGPIVRFLDAATEVASSGATL